MKKIFYKKKSKWLKTLVNIKSRKNFINFSSISLNMVFYKGFHGLELFMYTKTEQGKIIFYGV